MPIAAPLLVPFAELVGITTAGLALSQISDAVQSYMKSNPEQSMKILTMLSPELGIASMMKKKTTKPKVEEEVEKEPKLTAEEKREKFIELSKKRGRGRQDFIDLAQDLGLAKKGSEEQPPEDDEEEQILTGAQKTQLFKNLFREGGKNIDYARLGRATKRGNQGLYQEGLEALKKTLKGKKDGGRIGLRYGGDTMGGPNDKSKSGPGPDDRGSPEQNRNQRDIVASGGATDNYYEKVDYVGDDTVFGPTQKYSGDGFLSGYRNLDPITGQPKMGLSYLADRIQGINPLGIMLGLINPALGLAYRGYNLVKDKVPETFETFKESDTLVDFYNNMKTPVVENVINKDIRDIRTPPTTQLFDPVKVQALIDKAKEEENLKEGGRVGYQAGGVATPEQYAAALAKVGGGTEADKRRSLGNYLGDYISTQGQKLGNAAVIPFQAAKGILGIQGTPITSSMESALQNIIQNQIKNTGQLSGNINYNDYGVKTSTGAEFEGFGNRSITDPEAALATTLGQASYSVDPTTGKVNFTGGTAYDFRDDQFGGLGKFISKGGAFNRLPSPSNNFQAGATQYNPNISLSSEFLKPYQTTSSIDQSGVIPGFTKLRSQYYNPDGTLNQEKFKAANFVAGMTPSQFEYKDTRTGDIYGPSTYSSIAAGMYPNIYKPGLANGGLATMFSEKR